MFFLIFTAFVVLPHRKWVLETGREYEILIEIFDTDSHKIYPSDVSYQTSYIWIEVIEYIVTFLYKKTHTHKALLPTGNKLNFFLQWTLHHIKIFRYKKISCILKHFCLKYFQSYFQNVRVEAIFPSTYFNVLHSSINGTYHIVRTLLKGEVIIDGALVSVVDDVSG